MDAQDSQKIGRIMVVDDEPANVMLLDMMLQDAGYAEPVQITNPLEVLPAYLQQRPDLILLDINMPHMDGYQVMEQLKAMNDRLMPPIIILTAQHARDFLMRALEAGANDFVTKPFDRAELLMRSHNLLTGQLDRTRVFTMQAELATLNAELENKVLERTEQLRLANEQLRSGYLSTIRSIISLVELRHPRLGGQSREVAKLALEISRAMGLDTREENQVFIAGLMLHIGIIGLADHVLSAPYSELTSTEKKSYQGHTALGEQMLISLDDMHHVAPLIRGHHERLNGTGYPDRLTGVDIPIGARILAVASAFVDPNEYGLTSGKVTTQRVLNAITQQSGAWFDPDVVKILLELRGDEATEEEFAMAERSARIFKSKKPVAPPEPPKILFVEQLTPGMTLATSIKTPGGMLLLPDGQVLTELMIDRLRIYQRNENYVFNIEVR
jgi:putative two-component system response regulator